MNKFSHVVSLGRTHHRASSLLLIIIAFVAASIATLTYLSFLSSPIAITPSSPHLIVGQSLQLTATYNGTAIMGTWSSNNPAAITVSSGGQITAQNSGKSVITFAYSHKHFQITATSATIHTLSLTPLTIGVGVQEGISAVATLTDGNSVIINQTNPVPSLHISTGNPAVAHILAPMIVEGINMGTTNLTITGAGFPSSSTVITVYNTVPTNSVHYAATFNNSPMAIQFTGSSASGAYQNLQAADIVYESWDGSTFQPLTALYWSLPTYGNIGILSSATPLLISVTKMYGGIAVDTTSSSTITAELASHHTSQINGCCRPYSPYFYPQNYGQQGTNTLSTGTQLLLKGMTAFFLHAYNSIPTYRPLPNEGDPSPVGTLTTVSIGQPNQNSITYTFDPIHRTWQRSINGVLQTDTVAHGFINIRNLIIMADPANEITNGTISTSHGTCIAFIDGHQISGTWTIDTPDSPPMFDDSSGNPLPVQTGLTWIDILPNMSSITSR